MEEARFGIGVLGGKVLDTISYELPEDAGERQMIIIDKRSQTPKKYPRNQEHQINHRYLKNSKIQYN